MFSKTLMAVILPVMAGIALFASIPALAATASSIQDCPPSTVSLDECYCSDSLSGSEVTVSRIDGAIASCLTSLANAGYTKLYKLSVASYPPLNMTENMFTAVHFEYLYFYDTTIVHVDPNFLGTSTVLTNQIRFYVCSLQEGLPRIVSDVLRKLRYSEVTVKPAATLRKNALTGLPNLTDLTISQYDRSLLLTVNPYVFRSATKLRRVELCGALNLRWASLYFTAPDLETLYLGTKSHPIVADTGSLQGIPAGLTVRFIGVVSRGIRPSVFFNVLRGGARLYSTSDVDCDCDLAWIRYSSFIEQVDIDCTSGSALADHDLSHCPFFVHVANNYEL